MNILMPSAGRRYKHIKLFKECEQVEKVITTDIDYLSSGIHAADKCYRVPRTNDPNYIPALIQICQKENIDVVIPLLDLDILLFSRKRELFENEGIRLLLSPEETIEIALDKLKTANFLIENGLPSPVTVLASEWEKGKINYPVLIKPRFPALRVETGYDISVINNDNEIQKIFKSIEGLENNYVFQEYLTGMELSIDFFCQENGDYVLAIPANRISALTTAFSKNGGTMDKGWTFHDEEIEEMVIKATKIMDFYGPANFGGYRSEDGITKITEINARLTGGATLSVLGSGINLFQWSIDLLDGKEITAPDGGFVETVMTSYVEPVFFPRGKDLFDEI